MCTVFKYIGTSNIWLQWAADSIISDPIKRRALLVKLGIVLLLKLDGAFHAFCVLPKKAGEIDPRSLSYQKNFIKNMLLEWKSSSKNKHFCVVVFIISLWKLWYWIPLYMLYVMSNSYYHIKINQSCNSLKSYNCNKSILVLKNNFAI